MTLEEFLRRPEWHDRAECRGLPTKWFYPDQGGKPDRRALEACAQCAVATECHEAGGTELFGIWGGEAGRLIPNKQQPINHGTAGGYQAHIRRGIPACDDCKHAHSVQVQLAKRRTNRRPGRPIGGEWGVNLTGTFGRRHEMDEAS